MNVEKIKELDKKYFMNVFGERTNVCFGKPSVWSIEQIVEKLGLPLEELVMVDDLKPGRIMAENAGIDFIAAGWAHAVPQIVEDMKRECNYYCSTVEEFAQILFPSGNKE